MGGRLIYLMGPSGSGKDTVLQGLARLMGEPSHVASRMVTRPLTDTEHNAVSVTDAEFLQIERNGGFAMSWRANGLAYGIRWSDIGERLLAGHDVLVNGSREYLPEARRRFRTLVPILLVVDAATLQRRLTARGRESEAQIHERMQRNARYTEHDAPLHREAVMTLDNTGPADATIKTLYDHLRSPHTGLPHHHATHASRHGQCRADARL